CSMGTSTCPDDLLGCPATLDEIPVSSWCTVGGRRNVGEWVTPCDGLIAVDVRGPSDPIDCGKRYFYGAINRQLVGIASQCNQGNFSCLYGTFEVSSLCTAPVPGPPQSTLLCPILGQDAASDSSSDASAD